MFVIVSASVVGARVSLSRDPLAMRLLDKGDGWSTRELARWLVRAEGLDTVADHCWRGSMHSETYHGESWIVLMPQIKVPSVSILLLI